MKRDYVTIVSGLPRSGTSMMMRMLDAGGMPILADGLREQDEDNPRGYWEFEPVKKTKQDPSWLANAAGKGVKMVYRLLYDLPADRSYRVVLMKREMSEVLASQAKLLKRHGQAPTDESQRTMAALFEVELKKVKTWLDEQRNIQWISVSYNQMLAGPPLLIDRINEFLGGDLNTRAMQAVVEPSLYRNRAESGILGGNTGATLW